MAKKRNTASLIDKFTNGGTEQPQEDLRPAELTEEQVERLQITEELQKALAKERTKNVGRPPKYGVGRKPQEENLRYGDTRFTIIVKKSLQKKLKYISLMETRTLKDILGEVLGGYVEEWEKANGSINIK